MDLTPLSLGSMSIEFVHEQAILLWIEAKMNPAHAKLWIDDNPNLAVGIFFTLTDQVWPPDVPKVSNSIDLCHVLSQAFGQPPLTEEQTEALRVKSVTLALQYERGGGPMRLIGYLAWAHRIGYALAVIAMVVSGFSFWLIGLAVAVWLCYGAARTAARNLRLEGRPAWEVPVIATIHLAALLALYSVSIVRLVQG